MAALYANEAVGSKDFNPDQLRDDRGQWTDMPGAHVGGRSTPYWDTPESQVLASWTGAESGAIQKGYEKGKPVSERAKLFDRALKALPPLPVGTPVLRAVNLDLRDPEDPVYRLHKPEDIADYYRSQIGDVITYEHPESASTQPLAAEKFTRGPGRARVVFDIDTPQAKSVAEFASHREAWESEAVVPPGKYRITGVEIREFLVAGDRGPGQPGGDTIRIAVVKLKDINEAIKSGKTMEHILLKAVATTTDQGIFEAVISTESVDREKDIVSATGMVDALHKWNRPIPLAWNHSTKAEDIFGHLDPQSAKEVSSEVVATGQVDLESQMGQEAWRSFKNRTIGFSFGYLIPEGGATNRKGGGRHITALDIFEVTATPTPMNNDTRVLSTKSADELRKESDRLGRELIKEQLGELPEVVNDPVADSQRAIPISELVGVESGDLKAVWSAAFINTLPDGAFLYIESGGSKDDEGKTAPRSLRHFPYKDDSGAVDLPHLRNALARISQATFLSQSQKDSLTAKAQRILDNANKKLPSERELRKGSDEIGRELVRQQLPDTASLTWDDTKNAPESEPQPTIRDLLERLDEMNDRIEALSAEPATTKSAEELRRESAQLERELAREDLPETKDAPEPEPQPTIQELANQITQIAADVDHRIGFLLAQVGVKAVWTTAYINGLPDSAFLYVEPGGTKDSEGKTVPRSLRHFPVKDAEGNVDMPHLRNAMARIPQSNLPQDVKDRCVAKAQRMMDAQKSADSQRLTKARPVDDLRRLSERAVLEIQSDGVSLRKPPRQVEEKAEVQAPPEDALRRQSRDLMFQLLREGIGDDAQ